VLCGRGGMSNHHPGNEWYRRLIRSNRPLYRACPKHTKLLVSKAIVQAVEQQGGRFLERNRQNGMWYVVPYKRAVDKTSQGLREKERDDDGKIVPPNPDEAASVQIPDSFSGKNRNGGTTSLRDLADVAIASARKDGNGAMPFGRGGSGSAMTGAAAQHPYGRVPPLVPPSVPPRPPSAAAAPGSYYRTGGYSGRQQQQYGVGVSSSKRPSDYDGDISPSNKRVRLEGGNIGGFDQDDDDDDEDIDDAPLPPTMEPRQSSMFQLLKQTSFFSGITSAVMGGSGNNNNSRGGGGGGGTSPVPLQGASAYPTKLKNLHSVGNSSKKRQQQQEAAVPPPSGLFSFASGLVPGGGGGAAVAAPSSSGTPGGDAPPPLGRLTSQVSDWLTSFWPLPAKKGGGPSCRGGGGGGGAQQHHQQPAHSREAEHMQSIQRKIRVPEAMGPDGSSDAQQMIATVAPPSVGSPYVPYHMMQPHHHQQLPPSPSPQQQYGYSASALSPGRRTSSSSAGSHGNKRKGSTTRLPDLPYDSIAPPKQPPPDTDGTDDLDPLPPGNLETSVSTALLGLASSPSKLFSGLTSFFAGSTTTTGAGVGADAGTVGGVVPLPPGGGDGSNAVPAAGTASRRSSRSLLDDYEETPLEARIRTVQ